MSSRESYRTVLPVFRVIILMWLIWGVENILNLDFSFLGIYPREPFNLIGILVSPLLHGNFGHITSNTLPLFVLGGMLFVFYVRIANWVFISCYFLTGLLVWLFARGGSFHIGASGLVYALAGFLISFGLLKKDFKSLLLSIIVVVMYGSMIYGIFPMDPRVSWESHLFGVITGIGVAIPYSKERKPN